MQNLNKENFWNEILERYPDAMHAFGRWIDAYKKEVGWSNLFGNALRLHRSDQVKFHDLPFEMQNGILARFDIECAHGLLTGKGRAVYEKCFFDVQQFKDLFQDLQYQLTKQQQ